MTSYSRSGNFQTCVYSNISGNQQTNFADGLTSQNLETKIIKEKSPDPPVISFGGEDIAQQGARLAAQISRGRVASMNFHGGVASRQ
jgi:hypothetical protein